MADIWSFYEYIDRQTRAGTVQLSREGEFGIPGILERFSLERISLEKPELSSLELNGFRLAGTMKEGEKSYACTMTVTARAKEYDCIFRARLSQNGDALLNEIYPPALAYVTLNFYSRPVNLFEHVWLKEAVIAADNKEETEIPLISLTLYYGEDCPLYKNYRDFLPEAGEAVILTGDAREPFGETKYVVEGAFLKRIELPFYGETKTAEECRLVINSHVAGDGWEENGETIYQCRVGVKLCVPVSGISGQGVWMSIDFGNFGESYELYANFDEGMPLDNAVDFIASMTGKSSLPEFPEWTSFGKTPLMGIAMTIEREQGVEIWKTDMVEDRVFSEGLLRTQNGDRLMGCAFYFALDLPDVPIPFFDRAQGGAAAELTVQWNMLNIGGFLAIVAGFHGVWKNHDLKVNITVPDLEIKGIYEQEMGKEMANGIFPGFMDLTVRYIRLHGYLPEKSYELDFELVNRNLPVMPIGAHLFQIDTIAGRAEYSPKGLQLAVTLEFTLLTAVIVLEGIYEKEEEKQLLTLSGGLAKPFRLSELVALITGKEAAKNSLDFVVSRLSLVYRMELSGEKESGNSLGTPLYFEFLCAIAFEWGDQKQIASSFHLQWEKDVYRFWITAGITLFECFEFAASCQVAIEGGEASFQDFRFMTKIRSIEITAIYDARKNFTFRVINFNLGELIEGLISLIAPEHNWYLPWPFTILKQITLKELEVVIDRQKETIRARYKIDLKILFLTVKYIELFYDYGNEDFFIHVITNTSIEVSGEGQNVFEGEEDPSKDWQSDEADTYSLNLLKDIFPVIKGAGDRLFSLKYLGIGQHIQVDIPESFEETAFPRVLENMKKSIRKGGRPGLDRNHNWVAALQLKLINAVDITLLMCDPVFYGLQVDIGKGSELVEQLSGLSFTILYSKVTETIGMFYARLKFPEAFRKIKLGAIQIFLGEIGVWIYTNGNFKIDMGFPHNQDFSNSFGLTYLLFTGKGGFYFGLLNGDTSRAVPQVPRGHFEAVVELGVGISAGAGREISAGPLKAGAYVMLTAIFEGVFANYVPEGEGLKDSIYYKVKALAGVTASIYGSVDFVLIQIGFSVNLSFSAELVLESYQPTELSIDMSLSVSAYIKILFIKISFSFSFTWNDKFILGERSVAPWEIDTRVRQAALSGKIPSYDIQWYDGAVATEKQELCAEIIYYFTFDGPEPGKESSGKRKIAFLSLLHGMTEETCFKLGYQDRPDTPFARLVKICFRRALLSVREEGQKSDGLPVISEDETISVRTKGQELTVDRQLLEYLSEYLSRTESFEEGFSFEELNRFLACNVTFSYIKSNGMDAAGENGQIDGIPFPLWPKMELTWFSAPDTTMTYDLEQEPLAGEHFFADMQAYYRQLAMWNPSDRVGSYGKNRKPGGTSVSEFMFAQYFYMLTKIVVSLALDKIGDAEMSPDQAAEWITDAETLEKAAGMISRFSYGGSRAYVDGAGTRSMYDFAGQEFDGLDPEAFSDTDVIHRMSMRMKEEEPSGFRDSLPRMPEIGLYQRYFGEPVLQGRNRSERNSPDENSRDRDRQGRDSRSGNSPDRNRQDENSGSGLEWSFTKAELIYPGGALQMSHKPKVMPFYRRQPKTLELKNPQGLQEQADTSFWEIQSRIGGDFQIVTYENEEPVEHPFERGVLLRIPIKANQNDIFEIEPLGYGVHQKLTAILRDQVVSITPYRDTNELDPDHCGFAGVDESIFLYRHNLCLEAEKPRLRRIRAKSAGGGTEEKDYENSAWLTETTQFLSLLKDAAMVNARGYYVKFHLEERQILEDGRMTLILWVRTTDQAEEIKIIQEGITKESHPVLLTKEEISVYAYQPGTFAFSLEEETNGSEIQEQYQMLGYQILENQFFNASNESRPVIAQEMKNGNGYRQTARETENSSGYSQIVPAYCFAKKMGETPYGGIVSGSSLKMDFRLIDLLGNRSASGITWEIPYGYTDPLLPVSVYPHTKCAYELKRSAEGYSCCVTFSYVEENDRDRLRDESEKSNENLRLACRQLACEDMRCFIELCGTETQVDKALLLAYVKGLCQGEVPEPVVYELPFAGGEDIRELKAAFLLKRDEHLLSDVLKGTEEAAEVLTARSDITENTEKINQDYLAVRGLDGQLFYVPPMKHTLDGYEIWTMRPLSNKLLQLKEIPLADETGTMQSISYYNVDLEEWAADFLTDLEGLLKPDSIYGEDRDACETLLAIKKNLAQAIASGVTKISGNVGNPEFENAAAAFYQNLMLQNLSAGRETDGVILLQSEKKADMGKAWCFRAESDHDGFTLKPGKLRTDGILPVGICAADISKQMRVDMDLRLTFTDWEIAGDYFYEFLTVQEQHSVSQNIKANLPYKRFPMMPVLRSQEYAGEKDACRWKYEAAFVHQTAEQDILTLRLLPKSEGRLRNAEDGFLLAMAQYRYLRDKLLVDTSLKERLMECCRNICGSWSYGRLSMRTGSGTGELKIRFSLSFEERKLVILKSDIELEKLKISMKTSNGEYCELNRGEGNFYILPEELAEPYEFLVSVLDLDIREVNRINTYISVTRNQEIAEMNDLFLYRSDEAVFADDLLPSLIRQETVDLGSFEKENFIQKICGLCDGFGKVSMEVYCKAPVSVYGEEMIYSSLPVLYVPDIAVEGRNDKITLIYNRVEAWLNARFGGRIEELVVQVRLALFAAEDPKRNLVEFADLEFRMDRSGVTAFSGISR